MTRLCGRAVQRKSETGLGDRVIEMRSERLRLREKNGAKKWSE